MADATVDPPPIGTSDYDSGLSVPPFDTAFFSQQLIDNDGAIGGNQNDVVIDDFDLDFDLDQLLDPTLFPEFDCQPGYDASFPQFAPNLDQFHAAFESTSSESRHVSGDGDFSGDRSLGSSEVLNSGYLTVPSPESNGSNQGTSENCDSDVKVVTCPSPESHGSRNCGSNVSEDSNNCVTRLVISSPNLSNSSIRVGVVSQKIKFETSKNNGNSSLLKRKKDCEDLPNSIEESRIIKSRKSNCNLENNNDNSNGGVNGVDEKRKARLVRNRESAQLSRQRKKHYVEELEDKVKLLHSTIQDLNAKVSYFMAENATLRQQMGGGGAVPPLPMALPPPGMYPHPAMMYPWMPCAPPYMMKPQGSQVPLLPIPRLKSQHSTKAPKVSKKVESKKNEGPKTKKVAGVSFLGLLFFMLLFGGLAPMINMRYGGVRESLTGGESYVGGGFLEKHHGRVLMVNGSEAGERCGESREFSSKSSLHCDQRGGHDNAGKPNSDEFGQLYNGSEPLVASLYVPRNDKLVKIDGNLIIHSVLASEKAMSSHWNGGNETSLAVPGDLGPAIPVPSVRMNGDMNPQLRALGFSSADKDNRKPKATDGRLQQWFREGLAGPMLSSGMCTEVFQFAMSPASPSAAIFPVTTTKKVSDQTQNSTHLSKGRNRRILRGLPIPLPESSRNISKQHTGRNPQKEKLKGNNSASAVVVSVLVDPREAGDADVGGVMGTKSLSRIFVVVLVDSVKYVTYSCMLPFTGSAHHLVAS